MPRTLTRAAATALLALAAAWGNAQSGDWGDVAVISGTLGNNANRLCLGDGGNRVTDIGCPTYAPSVSTAGHVSITGNISANKFIGDGSGLSGMGEGDRVTSNTHAVIANGGTGYVSLTTAGSTWGYLGASWSYPTNLFANTVSSSLVSATNVSATYIDATRNGTVSGTYGYFRYISGTNIHGTFTGDGSGLTGVIADATDRIVSGTHQATRLVAISETGYISITQAGANSGWFDPYRGLVTLGVSTTGPISGTSGYFTSTVGIGVAAPGALLHLKASSSVLSAKQIIEALDNPNPGLGAARSTGIEFWSQGATGTGRAYAALLNEPEGNADGTLTFHTRNNSLLGEGTIGSEKMRLTSLGRLGLGMQSLTATLQVSGSFIVSTSAQSTTPSLYVGTNGLVGIGTSAPGASLHTVGTMLVVSSTGSSMLLDPGVDLTALNPGTTASGAQIRGPLSAHLVLDLRNNDAQDAIAFRYSAANSQAVDTIGFVMKGNGKVGIGTPFPTASVDIVGTVSASDAIQVGSSSLACSGARVPPPCAAARRSGRRVFWRQRYRSAPPRSPK